MYHRKNLWRIIFDFWREEKERELHETGLLQETYGKSQTNTYFSEEPFIFFRVG